ncbi:hypothetical protein ABPG75_008722 [Micractinium tetrahymenae]
MPCLICVCGAAGGANTTIELATTEPEVRQILLAQKAAWNWAEFSAKYNFSGWDEMTNICSWSGVQCSFNGTDDQGNDVWSTDPMDGFSITIACYLPDYSNDKYPSNYTDGNWYYHHYDSCCCAFPALNGPLLGDLARLGPLTNLNLHGQRLNGSLPDAFGWSGSFPNLESLDLGQYGPGGFSLSGTLPSSFGNPEAFAALESLVLGPNHFTGTLPDSWGAPEAFPSLNELYIQQAFYEDWRPIPASWGGDAFPRLSYLVMPACRLNGTLPASLPAVSYLDWSQNGLSGTLPATWGGNQPFPTQTIILSDNQLSGTLPPEWGSNRSLFHNLIGLDLSSSTSGMNLLTGPFPASWGPPAFRSLVWINVSGNAICGDPPKGFPMQALPADRGKVCGADDPTNTCLADCPLPAPPPAPPSPSAPAPPPASGASSSGSSTNIGAIVGAVVGGVVLLAAVLAFLAMRKGWLRRGARKPRPRSMESAWALIAGAGDGKGGAGGAGPGSKAPRQHQPGTRVPPGDGVPSGAVSTVDAASVGSDPVLLYISTRMAALHRLASIASAAPAEAGSPAGSRATVDSAMADCSPGSSFGKVARSGLSADVQQWEVRWEDLRLDRLIGKGSFGRVYLAYLHESPVAAKLLMNADECRDETFVLPPDVLRELQKEAALLLQLRHQNIVSFMGLCPVPPCLVTEHCARGSLFDVLQGAAQDGVKAAELTWPLRLRMALDAARGLLYLHRHSPAIIHRDVKSPNLLVDEHMRIKVADFNLSKILHPDIHATTQSSIASNPIWLAPEVMAGERPSAASDVYSFALVMLEASAVSGAVQIYYRLVQGERPDIPPLEELPGPDRDCLAASYADYTQLMRECWAEAPADRPGFAEVVPRLRAMLEGLGSGQYGASSAPTSTVGSRGMNVATPTGS